MQVLAQGHEVGRRRLVVLRGLIEVALQASLSAAFKVRMSQCNTSLNKMI